MATSAELAWLKTMVPAAQQAQAKSGIPAAVTLAQCILESSDPKKGWGQSSLALEAHNYFGIKAEHLADPSTYEAFPAHEYIRGECQPVMARFEKYYDAADSFTDHAQLLSTAVRYRNAMLHAASPDDFAACLQTAGYSTSPSYARTLVELMHDYNLYQYDTPPTDPAQAQEKAA
jgi:flagellum-specific peptidoglycan hydrolase FlgJ